MQFIAQDEGHDDADEADNQTAEQGLPEAIHGEVDAEGLADAAGEHQHACVDKEGEQAQRKQDQRAGEEFEQGAHQGIEQTKDERQPKDARPFTDVVDARHDEHCQI